MNNQNTVDNVGGAKFEVRLSDNEEWASNLNEIRGGAT